MTGNAVAYFKALARCCPPQPELAVLLRRTRRNSIRHCRNRIMLGMDIMRGTRYCPPHPLSGFAVDTLLEKSMHVDTNRSPSTLAYEVRTSASRMSPNLPSWTSASPPSETLRRVVRKRERPAWERRRRGMRKERNRKKRYDWGRICQRRTAWVRQPVKIQKRTREMARGMVRIVASRKVER